MVPHRIRRRRVGILLLLLASLQLTLAPVASAEVCQGPVVIHNMHTGMYYRCEGDTCRHYRFQTPQSYNAIGCEAEDAPDLRTGGDEGGPQGE